ncbi:hypothetical protein ABZW10_32445 [Kitasatospora sp. NPDC004723]|uniref:hypothetical protein n=1 Tax=Kitasatospora sp. NPDC004723 TaxID=3154288 RepID=UPI0033A22BA6
MAAQEAHRWPFRQPQQPRHLLVDGALGLLGVRTAQPVLDGLGEVLGGMPDA